MSERLHLLRKSLERQHERIAELAASRPDLRPALEPVLEEARSAIAHLHVLARPDAVHGGADVVGSA